VTAEPDASWTACMPPSGISVKSTHMEIVAANDRGCRLDSLNDGIHVSRRKDVGQVIPIEKHRAVKYAVVQSMGNRHKREFGAAEAVP
jgi:hypothetical protein